MSTLEKAIESFGRVLNKEWFRLVYLLFVVLVSSFLILYTACFSTILVPAFMFLIPYWLKERSIRRFMLNGLGIAVLTLVLANFVWMYIVVSATSPQLSGQSGTASLSGGVVQPYRYSGGPETTFNFSVVYKNTAAVSSSQVNVSVVLLRLENAEERTIRLVKNTTMPVSQGWLCTGDVALVEGVYVFEFKAETGNETLATVLGWGPINAPWTAFYSTLLPVLLSALILPVSLYYIIVGMYWWTQKARTMRVGLPESTKAEPGSELKCRNCGRLVTAELKKCPRCGSSLESEAESGEEEQKSQGKKDTAAGEEIGAEEKKD